MSTNKEMVRFFTFSAFHGKNPPAGSTNIRVNQLIKYWPESELYMYGEKPDVLIFQKVYISEDYKFPKHFPGIKILDICDPDWLDGYNVVETCQAMDAVVCPTQKLADYLKQFSKKVVVIADRFDLEVIPAPRKHLDKAKTVVWFGYSHNADTLRPAIPLIEELGLDLLIVSDDDPIANRWSTRASEYYTFKKYNDDTIYQDLQTADFAVLPDGLRPQDVFKSNNKTIKANLAGLPVAKTPEEVNLYMDAKQRQKWIVENYGTIRDEYDVRQSVKAYQQLIQQINEAKSNSR